MERAPNAECELVQSMGNSNNYPWQPRQYHRADQPVKVALAATIAGSCKRPADGPAPLAMFGSAAMNGSVGEEVVRGQKPAFTLPGLRGRILWRRMSRRDAGRPSHSRPDIAAIAGSPSIGPH